MNKKTKKTISSFAWLGGGFLAIALVFGFIIHTGANHPPMRYPDIGSITSGFINNLSQTMLREASLSLSSQGPFNWGNAKDLGFDKVLGEWANELDPETIVYFRRDKDATWQGRAQQILSNVDVIAEELSECLGQICCSADSANGRKIPIYLPETSQEYAQVLEKLCNGRGTPTAGGGSSVIEIGPLGCQNKGIVLHPDLFAAGEDVAQALRKEMARYAYFSSVDYNEDIDHPAWFTEGFLDYFAQESESVLDLSKDLTDWAEKEFTLSGDVLSKNVKAQAQAGASFLQFLADQKGDDTLEHLMHSSLSESLESAFSENGIDFEALKSEWIQMLRGGAEE